MQKLEHKMKHTRRIIVSLLIAVVAGLPVNAGVVKGGLKGIGKGAKTVVGCANRGVKGVGKGAKTTVGGVGKAVKTTL